LCIAGGVAATRRARPVSVSTDVVERGIDCAGGSGSASSDSSTLFDAAEQVLAQTDLRLGGQRTIPDGASRVSTRTRALASARLLG
jgi:hypothetical protein